MPEIVLRSLVKRFGRTVAIDDLSARVEDREFFVVVGPTACGKTTLLRLIAGLIAPDRGEIMFDGAKMNEVPPDRRGVRMVFQGQDYALFPHLAVYQKRRWSNLSFPLRLRGEDVAKVAERVEGITRRLRIGQELFPRKPRTLSEGQKQRVALGKAMVLPPKVFLLDEPLAHLDPPARAQAREELRKLHDQLGTTTLHVTHDLGEAFLLADRLAVMVEGKFVQVGSPREIREHPASAFVANFVDSYREALRRAFG
jgi:ABC-type sugar transport system ATPase subunit